VPVVPLPAPRLVGDVMATEPIMVRVDTGLAEAARLFERHAISGMPVTDDAGTLVGVISESDLLRARATDYLWASWPTLRVKNLMTTPALTVGRDEPLTAAARRMERHHVSRLVVVAPDEPTRPIGVIAISDLLRAMADPGAGTGEPEPPPPPEETPPMDVDGLGDRGD
jgi:CBS domain-containing protein